MAGVPGLEPGYLVLETRVLPLDDTPKQKQYSKKTRQMPKDPCALCKNVLEWPRRNFTKKGEVMLHGVNYEALDYFKREALKAVRETLSNTEQFGITVIRDTVGDSATLTVFKSPLHRIVDVTEGLGTKNLVADAINRLTVSDEVRRTIFGSCYRGIARDTIAMIVNDLVTLGAQPIGVKMHLAVGSARWFENEQRWRDLISGWKEACDEINAAWTGGETPELRGIVNADHALLSGSAWGIIPGVVSGISRHIENGDTILLLASSGVHANGLTNAREIARRLSHSYKTEINDDGLTYGDALLIPTTLYVKTVLQIIREEIPIHYAANITGHGWRKLMRHREPFVYVIETLPPVSKIFTFMQKHGEMSDARAYETWNMGAGFALFLPERFAASAQHIADSNGVRAYYAGHVEKRGEIKQVLIKPKDLILGSLEIS